MTTKPAEPKHRFQRGGRVYDQQCGICNAVADAAIHQMGDIERSAPKTVVATAPDLIAEVEALLAKATLPGNFAAEAEDLLRRLVEEVKRLRGMSTDEVIRKIEIIQEKYPGQCIEISVGADGYCCVTRVDRDAMFHPIAEGATMGDVFED